MRSNAPILDLDLVKIPETVEVESYQDQLIDMGNGGDLSVGEGGCLPKAGKVSSFYCMVFGRSGVIRQKYGMNFHDVYPGE